LPRLENGPEVFEGLQFEPPEVSAPNFGGRIVMTRARYFVTSFSNYDEANVQFSSLKMQPS